MMTMRSFFTTTAHTAAAAAVVLAASLMGVANGDLVKMCVFYKPAGHVRTDPILSNTCVSDHVHTFYGPQQFHPQTTNEDLRNTDPRHSTSVFVENQSLYWHPTIYKVGFDAILGEKTYELADIAFSGPYYRWDKDAPAPAVEAFPQGFRMIAGFPDPATGSLDGVRLFSECLCPKPCTRADSCESESTFFPSDGCGEMGIAMNFPTCWNSTAGLGDTNDHISHMAYTTNGEVDGPCPEGFDRRLPQIQLFVRIHNYEGGQYTFSDNTLPGDTEVFHADFMEGWKTGSLENIIENCQSTQNQNDSGDLFNPPCACEEFLTRKDTLLTDVEDGGAFDAEAAKICPIDTKSYIVDENVQFGVGGLPRGSCSAPVIPKNGNPPFVENCGLQFNPPNFNEENCEGGGDGGGPSIGDDDDDDDDEEEEGDDDDDDDDDDDEDVVDPTTPAPTGQPTLQPTLKPTNDENPPDVSCVDSTDKFLFKIKKKGTKQIFKSCKWLKKKLKRLQNKPEKQIKLCNKKTKEDVKRKLSVICPESCGITTCDE